jgi:hypothetical protein
MTKRTLFTLLAVAAVAVVAATPAGATCGTNQSMGTYASCGPDYYGVFADPGVGLGSIQGDYWQIGAGNAAVGLGKDNGNYEPDGTNGSQPWFVNFGTPGHLTAGWGTDLGTTDGCPVDGGKVALAMYDKSADGRHAYMTIAVTQQGTCANLKMDFAQGGAPNLVEIPKPTITASSHTGTTRNVTMTWNIPAGLCNDWSNSGQCPLAITGWDVVKLEKLKSDGSADANRASTAWSVVGTVAGNTANTASVSFACTTTANNTATLALRPKLDGGFIPNFVGAGSTKVECDPTLADPGPKFKVIDKKVGPAKVQPN